MSSTACVKQKDEPLPQDVLVLAPEERREAVLNVIRSAQQRLLLSVFRCTDYLVLDELAEAVARGVRVEALLTPRAKVEETKKLKELGTLLEGIGIEVRRYCDPIVKYHAKYVVADDGPALVATLNFTEKCFTNTCDSLLVTHDAGVIRSLQTLFEIDSAAAEHELPESLTERLIVGPDQSRARFTALIESARQSVRIIDHKVADPTLIALLKEKKASGVTVQVLGRGDLGGLRSHGKMILVDGAAAVIGSIALAPMSLDFRREVAIVISDAACVARLNRFFDALATAPEEVIGPADSDDTEDED